MHIRFSLSPESQPTLSYCIGRATVKTQTNHRDLGILVRYNLSWSDHCNQICYKAYCQLNLIRRTVPSSSLKRSLYVSLVRSHMTYCCQLWRSHLIKDIIKLERVQRRSTKFILKDYESDYKCKLTSLNLLPLMLWFELQDLTLLVKSYKEPMDNVNIHEYVESVSLTTIIKQNYLHRNSVQFVTRYQ